jgi:hypothetical protein
MLSGPVEKRHVEMYPCEMEAGLGKDIPKKLIMDFDLRANAARSD